MIYTVGHGNKSIEELLQILKKDKIECLVDVRSYPGSRKYPHFNKENLQVTMKEHNIIYVHILDLGGRRNKKTDKHTSIEVAAFASYACHMESEEFLEGYEDLKKIAKVCKTAYMCSETLWWKCHRRMISDRFEYDNWQVYHLGIGKQPVRHKIWQISRIDKSNNIIYDQ